VRQKQQAIREDFKELKARPKPVLKLIRPIEIPIERPSPTFIRIRDEINRLSNEEEIRPEEVDAIRMDLERAIENTNSEKERVEYKKMIPKLDVVQSIADLQIRERELTEMVEKSQKNFDQLSGQFDYSFYGNIVLLLGVITKMGNIMNWKLDRELKRLQIEERKAKIQKAGLNT
jgi:hypothetical protein